MVAINRFFVLSIFLLINDSRCEHIGILGSGYVGLVTAVALSKLNHTVITTDIDKDKIAKLRQGILPFFEPNLEILFNESITNRQLIFEDRISHAIKASDVIIVAVGTPLAQKNRTDISAVENCIRYVGQNWNKYKLIILKSTIPIGLINKLKNILNEEFNLIENEHYSIASCPEFLREGSAIEDFFNPTRLVWGIDSEHPIPLLKKIYQYFIDKKVPIIVTNHKSAALIKYASNAFLAVKISFINEIANLCDKLDINISDVQKGLGLDPRIGSSYLKPGPGFGGSCLPKDTAELCNFADTLGVDLNLIKGACITNKLQVKKPFLELKKLFNDNLNGKVIAVLGLAFKPGTDDIRFSPAITILQLLIEAGAIVKAYDPVANENMRKLFPNVTYCNSINQAIDGVNGIMILTEWDEFKNIDLETLILHMSDPVIVDARNILNTTFLNKKKYTWKNIGQNSVNHLCNKF